MEYVERDLIWVHKNKAGLSWTDEHRLMQEIAGNLTIRFRRGDTAELYGKLDVVTPFVHWKKNFLEIKYVLRNFELCGTHLIVFLFCSRWMNGVEPRHVSFGVV